MTDPYRYTLQSAFSERLARNSRYSLRAFARDLGISAAGLSQILSGKQGMTASKALEVAQRLGLSPLETNRFRDQVVARHSRNPRTRLEAKSRLTQSQAEASQISIDAFIVVSDWYHFAILELLSLKGFNPSIVGIAKRFGISRQAARLAVERLERLKLLEVKTKGRWVAQKDYTLVPGGMPSDAIKKFHRQVLEQALSALTLQPVQNRNFSSTIIAIDKKDLPLVRDRIKDFRFKLMEELANSPDKNTVYCLSTQFFELTQAITSQRS